MANAGIVWGAWQAMQIGSADWDGSGGSTGQVGDNALITGDAVDLSTFTHCEVSLSANSTSPDGGVITVYILGHIGGITYELTTSGSPWNFTLTPWMGLRLRSDST